MCFRVGGRECLASGGADKNIIVWDAGTGARLHTLQDSAVSMLAVQHLAVDPVLSGPEEACLVSASSDPHVRRWLVRPDSWAQVVDDVPGAPPGTERRMLSEHETTVYRLLFDVDGDEVDLWTASADGTAKGLARLKSFACEDKFLHGDHVRAVAVTDLWVITAGRDEDLKVWDRSLGHLVCTLEGHYDEVTDLVVLKGAAGQNGRLCSVGIDGTVRTWPLSLDDLLAIAKEQLATREGDVEGDEEGGEAEGVMTAEEEAELAALMEEE